MHFRRMPFVALAAAVLGLSQGCDSPDAARAADAPPPVTLLNVSYDPTREFYRDYNAAFAAKWQRDTGQAIDVRMSHGGAGKQARAVMDGLAADVVTLALAYDIDAISRTGLIDAGWESELPNHAAPYTSTIVFLVRKGNPRGIRDWPDLLQEGIEVITPNPKTSGGARWNYLAAWGAALLDELGLRDAGDLHDVPRVERDRAEAKARAFVTELFRRVPVLDTGARGATNTFVQRGIGDVLLAWENEAFLALEELGGPDRFEIVVPSASILAEPPVAVVDAVARKHGNERIANAYLEYLYSDEAQRLAAKHYYRPVNAAAVDPADLARFPDVALFTIRDVFGDWNSAQRKHFSDGGIFDEIFAGATP